MIETVIYDQTFSIHDLMVRWGMHDNISLCASTDYWVNWHISESAHSVASSIRSCLLDTGVMMFRRSDIAFEILDTLITCPEDVRALSQH